MDDSKTSADFKLGTLVFAKMKGFPYWPGIIANPTAELKKATAASKPGHHCIFFFGSKNYSWIEVDKLKLYQENKDELSKASKIVAFKKALEEIEIFIEKDLKSSFLSSQDPFDYLVSSGNATPKGKKKPSISDEPSPSSSGKKKEISGRKSDADKTSIKRKSDSNASDKEEKKRRTSTGVRASGRLSESNIEPITSKFSSKFRRLDLESSVTIPERKSSYLSSDSFSFLSNSPFIRPSRAESPPLNIEKITETLAKKNIEPSPLNFGFIGLGKIGSGLVKNLLNSKHKVTVWNRSQEKCQEFIKAGAVEAITPGDVIADSDITFCCVSDGVAARDIVFGNCGVLPEIRVGKAYVEMSGIDATISQEIACALTAVGGRYLEVRFQGSKHHAEEGSLILLAAGDRSLYDDCSSAFSAFSSQKTFLGEVGKASEMAIILHSILATVLSGLSEVLSMADILGIPRDQLLNLFEQMSVISPFILEKCRLALKGEISPQMSVKHLQKDTEMALQIASKLDQRASLTAIANEYLKQCKSSGYKDVDIGALFLMKK